MSALLLLAHYITRIHFPYFKEPRFADVLAEINDLEESLQEPLKADVENSVVDFLIGGQVCQWIERPSNDDAIKHLESFCRTAQTAECMFKQFPFSWFSESMITLRGLRGLLDDSCFMFLKLHVEDLEWLVPGISGRRVVDDQPCLKNTQLRPAPGILRELKQQWWTKRIQIRKVFGGNYLSNIIGFNIMSFCSIARGFISHYTNNCATHAYIYVIYLEVVIRSRMAYKFNLHTCESNPNE